MIDLILQFFVEALGSWVLIRGARFVIKTFVELARWQHTDRIQRVVFVMKISDLALKLLRVDHSVTSMLLKLLQDFLGQQVFKGSLKEALPLDDVDDVHFAGELLSCKGERSCSTIPFAPFAADKESAARVSTVLLWSIKFAHKHEVCSIIVFLVSFKISSILFLLLEQPLHHVVFKLVVVPSSYQETEQAKKQALHAANV